jgi:hypothetical protein
MNITQEFCTFWEPLMNEECREFIHEFFQKAMRTKHDVTSKVPELPTIREYKRTGRARKFLLDVCLNLLDQEGYPRVVMRKAPNVIRMGDTVIFKFRLIRTDDKTRETGFAVACVGSGLYRTELPKELKPWHNVKEELP